MSQTEADRIKRAKVLLQNGDAAGVLDLLRAAMPDLREDPSAWAILGSACFELERWEEAERAARETVRLEPGNARHWSNLGTILRKQGRYDEAQQAQEHALSVDRSYRRAKAELAKVREERDAAVSASGWKVRSADGDFQGPMSAERLADMVAKGEAEPDWSARQATGRVVTVRDAIGGAVCDEIVRSRVAGPPAASPAAQDGMTTASQGRRPAHWNQSALVMALIAVIAVLSASLLWLLLSRHSARTTQIAASPETDTATVSAEGHPDEGTPDHQAKPSQLHGNATEHRHPTAPPAPSIQPTSGSRSGTRRSSAVRSEALSAIGDLQTAVGVGVNYRDYGTYVIEAKQKLTHLAGRVPEGAVWWTEIEAAMYDYEFAADAWDWKFDGDGVRNFVYEGSSEFRLTMMTYGRNQLQDSLMPRESRPGYPDAGIPPTPACWMLWIDGIVQTAWTSASQHIQRASATSG